MQNTFLLNHGKQLAQAGEFGSLWRVQEGVLRLEQVTHEGALLVHLAMPGDLVGVEALCAEPYAYSVTALTRCVLVEQDIEFDFARYSAVVQGFMQQQERTKDMMRLRTGTAHERLAYLLKLLAHNANGSSRELDRRDLPTLKESGNYCRYCP
jgi:CRP-like cAMP-binding protein